MDLFDFTPASRRKPAGTKSPAQGPGNPNEYTAPGEPEERIDNVTQLTRRIKNLLEDGIGSVWVEGEISNHRRQSSGHHYFTLKDSGAQLACVLFKGNATGLATVMGDGVAVQVFGDVTVYETRGQYQMIVRKVRQAGVGALQARFEALKQRLNSEGLFDSSLKRPIPRFPRTVAIVTSPTGAALQDMLNILRRRAPWLRVLVFPVRVQGAGAAAEIAAALQHISSPNSGLPDIDTVVVARGGGSLEDLWAFNEEVTARAVAACRLPVISAVGHEIDFTISDFAADLRAPTPSAAAELLAPDAAELRAVLQQHRATLNRRIQQAMQTWRRELEYMSRGPLSRETDRVLLPWRQRLDDAAESLHDAVKLQLSEHRQTLQQLGHQLQRLRPDHLLTERHARLALQRERLATRLQAALTERRNRLAQARARLKSLGPQAVLARGFSYTQTTTGKLVREARDLQPGEEFTTHLGKGKIRGIVKTVE